MTEIAGESSRGAGKGAVPQVPGTIHRGKLPEKGDSLK